SPKTPCALVRIKESSTMLPLPGRIGGKKNLRLKRRQSSFGETFLGDRSGDRRGKDEIREIIAE
ncbi:MAG: hypothetical protein JSW13_05920, partial [Candidatus Aerophobus sp.]